MGAKLVELRAVVQKASLCSLFDRKTPTPPEMAEDREVYISGSDSDSDSEGLYSDSELQYFDKDQHVQFLNMMYDLLPPHYQAQEINHLTLAYYVIVGLDVLASLDPIKKDAVIEWVLSFQALPKKEDGLNNGQFYGFHGSKSSQFQADEKGGMVPNGSHLASTYCALAILKTVGYDLSVLDSKPILKSMKILQQPDGCFMPIHSGAETDLRFVYCAASICYMLENWDGMDKERAKEYIVRCQSYEGGFGFVPGLESHGGATYCAVASLRLMGFIEDDMVSKTTSPCIINIPMLLDWSLQRQSSDGGFQGRPNKKSDTCYAFWVGGVLGILGAHKFINETNLRKFLLSTQSEIGGFSKFPGQDPDIFHSYYGICAFSLLKEPDLNPLSVHLGIADIAAIGRLHI